MIYNNCTFLKMATYRVSDNVYSLIWDVDNNIVELHNSYVTKFIGGKGINFFPLHNSYVVVISMKSDII